jgi:alpha-beta hydrolase superfamily lysophospholipase
MIKTKDGLELFTTEWTVTNPRACVVLTHGFGEHSGRYAHVAEAFNSVGASFYGYDLRGHGRSAGPRGHSPSHEHFLDDLGRVITRVKQHAPKTRIFVFGHSMGGNITLSYALQRPAGLAGCIVNAPWIKRAIEAPAWQTVLGRVLASVLPTFSQQTPSLDGMLSRDPAMDASGNRDPLSHRTMSARLFVDMSAAADALLARASQFKSPLLLTHGTADGIIAYSGSVQFFEACGAADKSFKAYEGGFHETHNDLGRGDHLRDLTGWIVARAAGGD